MQLKKNKKKKVHKNFHLIKFSNKKLSILIHQKVKVLNAFHIEKKKKKKIRNLYNLAKKMKVN